MGHASKHAIGATTEPQRGHPLGSWCDANFVEAMKLAVMGDQLVSPERLHDLDLFIEELPPLAEGRPESFVLHGIPPDTKAHPDPIAGHAAERCQLLGGEYRLTLWQDKDPEGYAEMLGHSHDEGREHQCLVERIRVDVRCDREVASTSGNRADNVIEDHAKEMEQPLLWPSLLLLLTLKPKTIWTFQEHVKTVLM